MYIGRQGMYANVIIYTMNINACWILNAISIFNQLFLYVLRVFFASAPKCHGAVLGSTMVRWYVIVAHRVRSCIPTQYIKCYLSYDCSN